jgi:ABC-type multidrug transport system ATPase subunit
MAETNVPTQTAPRPRAVERVPAMLELPLLSARGITKRWDRRKPPLLDGVDLVVEAGRIVSLIGGNGAGKTTLLRILANLIFPDAGVVRLDGLDPKRQRREFQRRLGFVSAGYGGMYARFSPRQHLDYWARLALVPSSERHPARERTLARFGLEEFADRRVDRLSMGQRQRVRLAMAFLHDPKLVLLDEPWNSLDPAGIAVLTNVLLDFKAGGGTVVCCSPTGADIEEHADETYSVGDGGVHSL